MNFLGNAVQIYGYILYFHLQWTDANRGCSPILAIYGPMIYTAQYVMPLMPANPLRGQEGGGWALKTETFWALWNGIKPLQGHGNEADFLGLLHKSVPHESLSSRSDFDFEFAEIFVIEEQDFLGLPFFQTFR